MNVQVDWLYNLLLSLSIQPMVLINACKKRGIHAQLISTYAGTAKTVFYGVDIFAITSTLRNPIGVPSETFISLINIMIVFEMST